LVKNGEDSGAYTLRVEGLSKVFGTKVAVDGVSFSVKEGEIFGVVGPNGAGKTTTVRMLTTLLPPTSGVAWVMGFDIVTQPGLARRYIGYVPQAVSVDFYHAVFLYLKCSISAEYYAALASIDCQSKSFDVRGGTPALVSGHG